MDGISWTDLDADEQRAIAMLRDGFSAEFLRSSCSPELESHRLYQGLATNSGSRKNAVSGASCPSSHNLALLAA
jgi:hypothetical protein